VARVPRPWRLLNVITASSWLAIRVALGWRRRRACSRPRPLTRLNAAASLPAVSHARVAEPHRTAVCGSSRMRTRGHFRLFDLVTLLMLTERRRTMLTERCGAMLIYLCR
jgi:hypothetical protein